MIKCETSEELAKAIKNEEDTIYVEGDLTNKVIRIKATGKAVWGVCAAALGTAIACYIATPTAFVITTPVGGASSLVGGVAATTVAATTLGTAVVPAIAIGVAAGGIGALNTLRDKYKIVERNDKYIKLQRK